ncbi:MAG: RibD family protein [Polyangiaceae bacterium]
MKPYVICHMCTTIDGKIISSRWGKIPGHASSAKLYETTAASFGIGAWLVGTNTMREFSSSAKVLRKVTAKVDRLDHLAELDAKRFAIGVDAKAALRFRKSEVDGDHTVVLITERASSEYLVHLRDAGVSYLFCGKREVDLKVALDKLIRVMGIRKLMLEGGGTFNGSMLHAGLIDEVSQVVVPVVDGGTGITSFFDIPGDPPKKAAASLRLKSEKKLAGGVRWVRYVVTGKPR